MKPILTAFNKIHVKAPKASRLYLKLRSKLLFLYLSMVILPIAVLVVCFYFITGTSSEKAFYTSASASLPDAESQSVKLAVSFESFADRVISEIKGSRVSSYIAANGTSSFNAILEHEENRTASESLKGAYIINEGLILKLYSSNKKNAVISNPSKQAWFTNAVRNNEEASCDVCIRFSDDGSSEPVLSIAKVIPSNGSNAKLSVLLLDFDYNVLGELSERLRSSLPQDCEFFIISSSGSILSSKDNSLLTLSADPAVKSFINGGSQKSTSTLKTGRVSFNGSGWFAACKSSARLAWSFVYMIPGNMALISYLPFGTPTIFVIILCLLVILILFPIALLRLLNPINKLTSVISDQEKAAVTISPKAEGLYKHASPGALTAATSELDSLIDKLYSLNLKQKEAELNALQNQINPHFLYNTLESIRGAALFHGIHDIAAMSKALSLMFRYSISSTVLVTVKEEIQHLENYMSIQNFRYENKFDLIYEIPYDFYSYKILKLSLQPLIENSIKHGLEMKLGKGTIKVAMFSLDNSIHIQVSDDGTGMPQKKIDELNRMLDRDEYPTNGTEPSDKAGTGIGVRNVNSRIKLYFGNAYGLKFQNSLSGTMVEIILPAVKE